MKKTLTALAALLAAAGLSACSPTAAETGTAPTPPPAAVGTAEPEVERPEADVVEEPRDGLGTFGGDGFVFEDGLELGISAPTEFTPSEYAAADETDHYVRFTVTVKNGTGAVWDPSMFYTTLSSGGVEMSEVFDTDSGLNGSPMTPVLPGESIGFDIGYPAADPADLVMNITIDWEHADVLFTS